MLHNFVDNIQVWLVEQNEHHHRIQCEISIRIDYINELFTSFLLHSVMVKFTKLWNRFSQIIEFWEAVFLSTLRRYSDFRRVQGVKWMVFSPSTMNFISDSVLNSKLIFSPKLVPFCDTGHILIIINDRLKRALASVTYFNNRYPGL